jgi:hypothetical protein
MRTLVWKSQVVPEDPLLNLVLVLPNKRTRTSRKILYLQGLLLLDHPLVYYRLRALLSRQHLIILENDRLSRRTRSKDDDNKIFKILVPSLFPLKIGTT